MPSKSRRKTPAPQPESAAEVLPACPTSNAEQAERAGLAHACDSWLDDPAMVAAWAQQTEGPVYYVVQPGDTLSLLAKRGTPDRDPARYDELMQFNCLAAEELEVGQVLAIPYTWDRTAFEDISERPFPPRPAEQEGWMEWGQRKAWEALESTGAPDAVEGLWDWATGEEEAEATSTEPNPRYFDQLDNDSPLADPPGACSPTSFAMALVDLHDGDEATVRQRTIELLEEHGGSTAHEQTEDLIVELLVNLDWDAAVKDEPGFFWGRAKDWPAWARQAYDGGAKIYKDPNAQQYVASLYPAFEGSKEEIYAERYSQEEWAPVIEALENGAVVTAQGGFTSSGHVVHVLAADGAGVVVNDPYGLWVDHDNYFKNGERIKPTRFRDPALLEVALRRTALNPLLTQRIRMLVSGEPAEGNVEWGKNNVYTWDEVESIRLGRWISVLRRRSP
ncbi:MAG: LysM peptidoglycan-binding domain-containing protein [Myxococcales bacterium]|nr:LysM peptidoglycan-binding domain-containing protein [Myxococcales bacterium]